MVLSSLIIVSSSNIKTILIRSCPPITIAHLYLLELIECWMSITILWYKNVLVAHKISLPRVLYKNDFHVFDKMKFIFKVTQFIFIYNLMH